MSDQEVLDVIKKHIKKLNGAMKSQGKVFMFFDGKGMLKAEDLLKRLDSDKKFRKLIIEMVVSQTIEILGKEPEIHGT